MCSLLHIIFGCHRVRVLNSSMSSLSDNRKIRVNGTKEPIEFKSNQWFGATVKAHRGEVVVSMSRGDAVQYYVLSFSKLLSCKDFY